MNTAQQTAINYFQSYTDYFWQWETDYMFDRDVIENAYDYHGGINCIAIPDGVTIAYKEQIQEVLTSLSELGLPPFGALILMFLATNSGETNLAIDKIFDKFYEEYSDFGTVESISFLDAHEFLRTIISIPLQYKKGKNRLELFIFLFKDGNYNLPKKYSEAIHIYIKNKAFELNECSRKVDSSMSIVAKDINALAVLNERYPTGKVLLEAWGKIVPVEIEPEDTEIASVSQDPDLIQQLIEDSRTFFMGNLIKRIWSGIQLPMHYVHPGEMPLGGISDITNKGNFDNLLISEFANDDLTFLHRIANKEALFIRRETNPEEDLRTRIFLIDTTIKNWGTPKILSFATAFALIHHPKNEMNFQSYAIGETVAKLAFDEKINIIEGLQITAPLLDASSAILQFIDTCEEENIEITVFTSPKTLQHVTMQRVFNLHHDKFGGIITADTEGNIDVYKLKNGAKRLVKHIQLPLKELWAKPPSNRRKQIQKPRKSEPIIEYPLLYGYPNGYLTHFFTADGGGYVLQKRGALYKMNDYSKGFNLLRTDIRFVTGMKKPMVVTMFEDEIITVTWSSTSAIVINSEYQSYTFTGDYSEQNNAFRKHLLVFEDELYLATTKHYSDDTKFLKIDIKHKFIDKITAPSEELNKAFEASIANYFGYFAGCIFTKIKSIAITEKSAFIFNNLHRLEINDDYLIFRLDKSEQAFSAVAEYVNRKEFRFNNGSKITIDKKGILKFSSANPAVETFYLSSYIEVSLGMATETEFAGNEYFLPESSSLKVISVKDFKRKYIDPFIVNIMNS